MKIRSFASRIAAIASVCLVGSAGASSIAAQDSEGHLSSLHARATMADGTSRAITLQGIGCTAGICSRVRATDVKADSVWLGSERRTSIVAGNRVLYVQGRFGRTEKLDLRRQFRQSAAFQSLDRKLSKARVVV